MLAVGTTISAVMYTAIYAFVHLFFMLLSEPFAMSRAGIFLAAFVTGAFSFLAFR